VVPSLTEARHTVSGELAFEMPGRILWPVNEVTRILDSIPRGDQEAAEELLPLVYEELRRLAALDQ